MSARSTACGHGGQGSHHAARRAKGRRRSTARGRSLGAHNRERGERQPEQRRPDERVVLRAWGTPPPPPPPEERRGSVGAPERRGVGERGHVSQEPNRTQRRAHLRSRARRRTDVRARCGLGNVRAGTGRWRRAGARPTHMSPPLRERLDGLDDACVERRESDLSPRSGLCRGRAARKAAAEAHRRGRRLRARSPSRRRRGGRGGPPRRRRRGPLQRRGRGRQRWPPTTSRDGRNWCGCGASERAACLRQPEPRLRQRRSRSARRAKEATPRPAGRRITDGMFRERMRFDVREGDESPDNGDAPGRRRGPRTPRRWAGLRPYGRGSEGEEGGNQGERRTAHSRRERRGRRRQRWRGEGDAGGWGASPDELSGSLRETGAGGGAQRPLVAPAGERMGHRGTMAQSAISPDSTESALETWTGESGARLEGRGAPEAAGAEG